MDKKGISLIVNGKDAGDASDEIKKIIKDVLDYDIQITAEKALTQGEQTKSADPVVIGALIFAIPGSILAAVQLADRLNKKRQLDRTLESINQRIVEKKEVTVKIQYPDGMIKELSAVDTVEILDHFNK